MSNILPWGQAQSGGNFVNTNVTVPDFLDSVTECAACPYTTLYSQSQHQNLPAYEVDPTWSAYQPAIMTTAPTLAPLQLHAKKYEEYFGFLVLRSVFDSLLIHGFDAVPLLPFVADLLDRLKAGVMDGMKLCRMRHLAERYLMVVGAYIDALDGNPVARAYQNLTLIRNGGVRKAVNEIEEKFLEALGGDFMIWMDRMGMILS